MLFTSRIFNSIRRTRAERPHRFKPAALIVTLGLLTGMNTAYAIPVRYENAPGSSVDWTGAGLDVSASPFAQPGIASRRTQLLNFSTECAPGAATANCNDFLLNAAGSASIATDNFFNTRGLASGDLIGPAGFWNPGATVGFEFWVVQDCPTPGDSNCGFVDIQTNHTGSDLFMGTRFTDSDGIHFGWIQARWQFDSANPATEAYYDIELIAWGYESEPGTPIPAGAVPEPATLALLTMCVSACAARRSSIARKFTVKR